MLFLLPYRKAPSVSIFVSIVLTCSILESRIEKEDNDGEKGDPSQAKILLVWQFKDVNFSKWKKMGSYFIKKLKPNSLDYTQFITFLRTRLHVRLCSLVTVARPLNGVNGPSFTSGPAFLVLVTSVSF